MKNVVTGAHVVEWVAKRTSEFGNYGAAVGIGMESDGKLIAGVVFNDYNGANICMHVASDLSRSWMNKEFLWFCFYYPFEQAKVKRITTVVAESNEAAIKFNRHIGFTEETRLKDAHPDGDLIVFRMFRDACRWSNRRERYEQKLAP